MGNLRFITALIFSLLFFSTSWGQEYLLNGGFEQGVAKWKGYCDAAGVKPVDGTGSPNANMAVTASTTNPLIEKASGILTKDANNRQGCGVSTDFTIDASQKAKVLQIELTTLVNSGTFVAGTGTTDSDVIVYLYDITNSRLIEPTTYKIFSNSTTLAEKLVTNFQTSPDSTSYRLILHAASTSASAYALKIEASVKPSKYVYGTPISDWATCTMTGAWSSNTTYTCKSRRVADSKEYDVLINVTGAPTSATLTVNLPSGDVIDTAKIASQTQKKVGEGVIADNGTDEYAMGVFFNSTTTVLLRAYKKSAGNDYTDFPSVTQAVPMTFASGDSINFKFDVPIVGLSGSTQVSDSYDGKRISAKVTTTSQAMSAATQTQFTFTSANAEINDGGIIGTNIITVPSYGEYEIKMKGQLQVSNASEYLIIWYNVNNGTLRILSQVPGSAAAYVTSNGSDRALLNAGDVIRFYFQSGVATTINTPTASISKMMGSAGVSVGEKMVFSGIGATSSSVGSNTVVKFNTITEDSHGCWNATNGDCAVPYSGTYHVDCASRVTFTGPTVNQYMDAIVQIDTVTKREHAIYLANTGIAGLSALASWQGPLLAGQKIRCVADTNLTSPVLSTSDNHTYMNIFRVK